jgi:hypothetical protein
MADAAFAPVAQQARRLRATVEHIDAAPDLEA